MNKKNKLLILLIGLSVSVILFLLSETTVFKIMELKSLDTKFKIRSYLSKIKTDDRIVIIGIDDKSLDENRKPLAFWISDFSELTNILFESGAGVVCFDLIQRISTDEFFDDFYLYINERSQGKNQKEFKAVKTFFPYWDMEFAKVISGKKVVLAGSIDDENKEFIIPIDQISFAVDEKNIAPVNLNYDEDFLLRRQPVYLRDNTGTDRICFGFRITSFINDKDITEKNGSIFLGNEKMILGKNYELIINYAGRENSFKIIPYRKVLNNIKSNNKEFFKKNFKDKIVLFGFTGNKGQDMKNTPFGVMSGVEINANIINTILTQNYIHETDDFINLAVIIILSVIICFLCAYNPIYRSFLYLILFCSAYFFISYYLFADHNLIISTSTVLISIIASYLVTYIYLFFTEFKDKIKIKNLFDRYVSGSVVKKILEDPKSLDLGGSYMNVSILFSDINWFTPISEKMSPHEIIYLLNEYFEIMIEVIFKNEGTLKQFVGDEIMAIFGAPYHQPDHSCRALKCAVEMRKAMEEWKEKRIKENKVYFDVKLGLHSGSVVCGNVGSRKRTEYAAVGDVVNTASRIMGLNSKIETKTKILVSKEIYLSAENYFEAEFKGEFQVKGKDTKLEIFEIQRERIINNE